MADQQQLRNSIPSGAEADPSWWPSHWDVEKVIEEEWFVDDDRTEEQYHQNHEEVCRNWDKLKEARK